MTSVHVDDCTCSICTQRRERIAKRDLEYPLTPEQAWDAMRGEGAPMFKSTVYSTGFYSGSGNYTCFSCGDWSCCSDDWDSREKFLEDHQGERFKLA